MHKYTAFRGSVIDFIDDPGRVSNREDSYRYFEDGLLVVRDGRIADMGPAEACMQKLPPDTRVKEYRNRLIMPGFIDVHVHYPQTGIIGAYGEQLLDWLDNYTFPMETRFKDPEYAAGVARVFLDELFRNGTTSAMVFSTVHRESAEVLFEAAHEHRMRLITGKVMMDRNAREDLLDTPESGYTDSRALIKKWHNRGRLLYALTPRFAPTSTPEQLKKTKKLLDEFPDLYVQTHLSENKQEIEWVKDLFPERADYLDVYDYYGLTSRRSVFAHCVHLSDHEFKVLEQTGSGIAFCPTSNLFLGSGLFPHHKAKEYQVRVGLATDVGGGTSFSLIRTLGEAYKIAQLQGNTLSALEGFYLATLGGARVLDLEDRLGNFDTGNEADFIVVDPAATPVQEFRLGQVTDIGETLFVLMTMGDDRNVQATYVNGRKVHERP